MKRKAKSRWLFPLLALSGLLAAGCAGSGGEEACTAIGGESGVAVAWKPADFATSASGTSHTDTGGLVAELCAHGVCESRTVGKADGDASPLLSSVELDEETGEGRVPVRFTVTARDDGDRVLFDERADVELRKYQPNGKDCPSTFFRATLTAAPEQGLAATPLGSVP
ncbi:hypothetical protein QCN29_13545 [Streptomyces sp. HNM0663]|uniref:Lipoprotein n=1 Tax=Streptomyces chengmaiensis TaxID=3040919 RepID=A0ABT6HP22_9ACTN|nr:hypothetical protein [Streptomyces chengmaiensis]MDH2389799.1 hypothetical protein [Streptomyces chengmaiensis]